MLGGEWLASDQSHKFAAHCGAMATDKLMNDSAQIISYNLSVTSKSQLSYKTNADVLLAQRLVRLARDGVCPLPRCIVSDDPRNEEARYGPLMPWMICGDPDIGRQGKRIRLQPPSCTIVVDRTNFAELPRHLALLIADAYFDPDKEQHVVPWDPEWKPSPFHSDGVEALGLGSKSMLLIIRVCDLALDGTQRQLPKCLVDLLTDPQLIKAGCCIGNDLKRLKFGHGVDVGPVAELGDLARDIFDEPTGTWGLERLAKTFGPEACFVAGKFSTAGRNSDWTKDNRELTTPQKNYLTVDVVLNLVLYVTLKLRRLSDKIATEKESEDKSACASCGWPDGCASLGGAGEVLCASCFAARRYKACWCSDPPGFMKCVICQFKPSFQAQAAEDENDGARDIDATVDFKVDPYHPMAGVLEAAGVAHGSHGAAATALSMICFVWEAACYSKMLDLMMTRYKVPEVIARFMIIRLRRTQPLLVRTWIPPPSVLLPMLQKWWNAFAGQWCNTTKKYLLDRPKVKAKYDRLVGLIQQGRFHDSRPIEETYEDGHTRSDGLTEARCKRPTTSVLEQFHLPERLILGRRMWGLIMASILVLPCIDRNNASRWHDRKGAKTYGKGKYHYFGRRRILGLQHLAGRHSALFPKQQRKCLDVNGPLDLSPDTGERWAGFAQSAAWDDLRDPDWKTANLLDELMTKQAEVTQEGCLPSSDVRVVIASAVPGTCHRECNRWLCHRACHQACHACIPYLKENPKHGCACVQVFETTLSAEGCRCGIVRRNGARFSTMQTQKSSLFNQHCRSYIPQQNAAWSGHWILQKSEGLT